MITPKLIISRIIDERAKITPVVKSWNGVPGYGLSPSNTNSPQQLSSEKTVTKTYPVNKILLIK